MVWMAGRACFDCSCLCEITRALARRRRLQHACKISLFHSDDEVLRYDDGRLQLCRLISDAQPQEGLAEIDAAWLQ